MSNYTTEIKIYKKIEDEYIIEINNIDCRKDNVITLIIFNKKLISKIIWKYYNFPLQKFLKYLTRFDKLKLIKVVNVNLDSMAITNMCIEEYGFRLYGPKVHLNEYMRDQYNE